MERTFRLLPVILGLFDGGAAAGAAAGGAAPAGDSGAQQGEIQGAVRGDASRGKSGESVRQTAVIYGRDTAGETVQRGDAAPAENSEEANRAAFAELINGKYKDAFGEQVQRIIDKRFREAKADQQRLSAQQPIIDLLCERHGVADGNMERLMEVVSENDPTIAERAEENGMSVEQQRRWDEMERQNARLLREEQNRVKAERANETVRKWLGEAEALRSGKYPQFDLRAETQNPEFLDLLRAGIPMEHAYEVIHRDEINRALREQTAANTERRVVDNIRAQGMRPRENGTSSQGSFVQRKSDPRTLTKQDHNNIAERVRRGEKIAF